MVFVLCTVIRFCYDNHPCRASRPLKGWEIFTIAPVILIQKRLLTYSIQRQFPSCSLPGHTLKQVVCFSFFLFRKTIIMHNFSLIFTNCTNQRVKQKLRQSNFPWFYGISPPWTTQEEYRSCIHDVLFEPILRECSSPAGIAPYVEAFDRLLNGSVAEFLRYSKILEGDVKTHVSITQIFHPRYKCTSLGNCGTSLDCWVEENFNSSSLNC